MAQLSFAQNSSDSLFAKHPEQYGQFLPAEKQHFGFYSEKSEQNETIFQAAKSVAKHEHGVVNFAINPHKIKSPDHLYFETDSGAVVPFHRGNHQWRVLLPPKSEDYTVVAKYYHRTIARLQVFVQQPKKQRIVVVPLGESQLHTDSLQTALNDFFKGTNVQFEIVVEAPFLPSNFKPETLLNNPNESRLKYTRQMQEIRDEYLASNASKVKQSLLFFVTDGFKNETVSGFMVRNKAMGFLKLSESEKLANELAREYLLGYVHLSDSLPSLDSLKLTAEQGLEINENPEVYSYFDDYEDVTTNNGLIAYYYFAQDSSGNIVFKNHDFLASVLRPQRRNTYSYHLQINTMFYKTLFKIRGKRINFLHLFAIAGLLTLSIVYFRRIKLFLRKKIRFSWPFRFVTTLVQMAFLSVGIYFLFTLINLGYQLFEVHNGVILEYHDKTPKEVLSALYVNQQPKRLAANKMGSEIIIHRGNDYYLSREKSVLYFRMQLDKKNQPETLKFTGSDDYLSTSLLPHRILAASHYLVLKIYTKDGKWLKDRVFNHLGIELTDKLTLPDPPKRVLLFVNGYRPTSLGRTFEESFADIKKNGLEFPNSVNRIFTDDRYNYWHPWNQIDDSLKARINPGETFYADGHHSVATSNYRSLLNFVRLSQAYPKRCKDPKHHVCYRMKPVGFPFFGTVSTYSQLPTRSNRKGFQKRLEDGRIAGRNLLQMLSELPDQPENDTLYIVAHSMGFAYAQGIIEIMKGKIHLGGYYIIAPEDAAAGYVNYKEWKEIWQYGSNLGEKNQDAPCLQDGVAPQEAVGGIPESHRIFIPEKRYKTKGFFDSHFIGWYTWILRIPEGQRGAIHHR